MGSYVQLRYEEREKIAQLWQSKASLGQIAEALGRCKSTVSRELKRNQAPPGQYWPDSAQSKALGRRRRLCLIDRNPGLRDFVTNKLCCHYWTPEQIAGWLKYRQNELPYVCHESIYAWVYSKAQRKEKLWKFLPRHKGKRGIRKCAGAGVSRIPHRVSIHERPKAFKSKRRFGNWEGDLMSFLKNSQHILVLRERKTMYTCSVPLPGKSASLTVEAMVSCLESIPREARKSLTLDNGGEFAAHKKLFEKLGIPSFFCDPYASWQKGGVENTNGRLRRDLPRKTDIHKMAREDFDETILNYNTTPRKSLGWMTPLEAFNKNLHRVALQT